MVANANVECHTAVQFFQRGTCVSHACGANDDIHNVQVTVSCGSVVTVFEVGQSQGRNEMPTTIVSSVETT